MSLISNFDTNGTYPAVFTSNIIDVGKFSNLHVFAFYNTNSNHTINWYISPSGGVAISDVIAVTAGVTSIKLLPVRSKYMSITYNASVTPFVMRTQHIFY